MSLKIEVEGTDGSGKTTALKYLVSKLKNRGNSVLETREVGSPLIPVNVKLRQIILDPDSNMSGEAMELVFAAMRVENDKLYSKVSQEHDYIVSDRGWLSHLAYTDHNVSKEFTNNLYIDFLSKITDMPDIVIYFDVNTDIALGRRISRGEGVDVIEAKGVEFQELVRKSFKKHLLSPTIANTRIFTIDANQDIKGVQAQMDKIIREIDGDDLVLNFDGDDQVLDFDDDDLVFETNEVDKVDGSDLVLDDDDDNDCDFI